METQVTIEHVKSRNLYPALTYDYNNLLLSCKTPKQCDNAKGNQELDLNPLMIECDIEIKINLAGELESKSTRAEQAITILNLNNPTLCNKRKAKIDIPVLRENNQKFAPTLEQVASEVLQNFMQKLI